MSNKLNFYTLASVALRFDKPHGGGSVEDFLTKNLESRPTFEIVNFWTYIAQAVKGTYRSDYTQSADGGHDIEDILDALNKENHFYTSVLKFSVEGLQSGIHSFFDKEDDFSYEERIKNLRHTLKFNNLKSMLLHQLNYYVEEIFRLGQFYPIEVETLLSNTAHKFEPKEFEPAV